ncbi:Essential MCU regulator, mitochondrial [Trichoplax sp. H2]|nr:Essential MCU regulator, mitochondrial [Trichoplax sp. H2]|eukprot:RDD45682.1 Essential MCU regulator, mitochondrial [Trichoplax sp. H2]
MAIFATFSLRAAARPSLLFASKWNKSKNFFSRTIANQPSAVFHDKPHIDRFGTIKAVVISVSFTYLGAQLSKRGAAFLEENDIFVPEDDD